MRHIFSRNDEPCTLAGLVLLLSLLSSPAHADEAHPPDFEKSFATIIVKNCLTCHNSTDLKGGLDLTQKNGLLKRCKRGPAIVVGKPDEIQLIERVTEGSLPPKNKGRRLAPAAGPSIRLDNGVESFAPTCDRRRSGDGLRGHTNTKGKQQWD